MIDTNAINSRQADDSLNQIERWRASGAIQQLISEPAYGEAIAGGNKQRVAKASKQLRGIAHRITTEQHRRHNEIERALFPSGAASDNQRNDAEIVFQAGAWGHILVTNDGQSRRQPRGILGARDELAKLDVVVMRPHEFVSYVRQRIAERDGRVRSVCAAIGQSLPPWIGED